MATKISKRQVFVAGQIAYIYRYNDVWNRVVVVDGDTKMAPRGSHVMGYSRSETLPAVLIRVENQDPGKSWKVLNRRDHIVDEATGAAYEAARHEREQNRITGEQLQKERREALLLTPAGQHAQQMIQNGYVRWDAFESTAAYIAKHFDMKPFDGNTGAQ